MRILSLSGGGIRGYLQARIVAAIESATGRSACQLFDLIVGTSTGGILGAGLALGFPAGDMAAFYRDHGRGIFRKSLTKKLRSVCGLADESYGSTGLEKGLAAVFGDAALSQARTGLCLTAYDIESRRLVLFKSWKATADPAQDHLLTVACRATAAAPTYFEPGMVKTDTGLMRACIDGGVWANNPAMVGLVEAIKRGVAPQDIRMLSIGAGSEDRPYLLSDARGWGLAGWARPLLDVLFSGQAAAVDYQCLQLLGDQYVTLQPTLAEPIPLDAVTPRAFTMMEFHAGRVVDSGDYRRGLNLLEGGA